MRPTPDNQIRRKLAQTAMFLRLFAIARAALLMVACMLLFFWGTVGLDYFFVLSKGIRGLLFVAGLATCCVVAVRTACLQVFHRMSWHELALFYERRVPELGESLLTVVTDTQGSWNRETPETENDTLHAAHDCFLHRTALHAAGILGGVRLVSLFNWINITALAGGVILLTALTMKIYRDCPEFLLWFSRAVYLSDERPPSRTILFLNGTNHRNEFFVRQGDPFELRIAARVLRGRPVREIEVITLQDDTKNLPTQTLQSRQFREEVVDKSDKSGTNDIAATCRVFTVKFATVLSSMNLVIRGGDAESTCQIHAIAPPVILSAQVRQTFPDYMLRDVLIEPLNAVHAVPEGTTLFFEFECDKPLKTIAIFPDADAKILRDTKQKASFAIATQALQRSLQCGVCLMDENGIIPRDPFGIHVEIVPDRPPVVKDATHGIGRRITPWALIPYTASVVDDYGINSLFMTVRKGNVPQWEFIKLTTLSPAAKEHSTQGVFDAGLLPLKSGDTLSLRITASDYKPVRGDDPHSFQMGTGPVRDFEIVEPAQLKESLEIEEYGYRDRLVNLIRQMEQAKNLVPSANVRDKNQSASWSRLLRDMQKAMFDAKQIAKGITELCDEIRNNRLCSSQQETRDLFDISRLQEQAQSFYLPGHLEELLSQVVAPLETLVEKEFEQLNKRLAESSSAPGKPDVMQKETITAVDTIIEKLNSVLVHMRSLQSFRELVDEFRAIRNDIEHSRRTTDQKKNELFHDLEK